MLRNILLIVIVFTTFPFLNSCKEKAAHDNRVASSRSNPAWIDTLIVKYVNETNNELVKIIRKDGIPFKWMFDRTENTDSAKFLVFQIGHSFENKFITDSWLYIDSLTRILYEYDVVNDSLIKWQNDATKPLGKEDVEEKIIDSIFKLPEIIKRAKYIEQETKGKRHLKVWVSDIPHLPDQKYYWVKAGEDNGSSLVTHFSFYVYADSMRIMYYDINDDKELTLSEWRKVNSKE